MSSLPPFIKIGDTYHNSNFIRNVTEEVKDGSRCIEVKLHGETNGYLFTIKKVCDEEISKSLGNLVNFLKLGDTVEPYQDKKMQGIKNQLQVALRELDTK